MKLFCLLLSLFALNASAADAVVSGPAPGQKTAPFKVLDFSAVGSQGRERDPVTENAGAPTAFVFVRGIDRSLLSLLRVVDQYGEERKSAMKTEIVFLYPDRAGGESRVKTINSTLRLKSPASLSLDGAKGPESYRLNTNCAMTVVTAKGGAVAENLALARPGPADAAVVLAALARLSGEAHPPTVEQLASRASGQPQAERPGPAQASTASLALPPSEVVPGAVPSDPKLKDLFRKYVQQAKDAATVASVASEIQSHAKSSPELTRQAIDGWTRVLHYGERLTAPNARSTAEKSLASLKAGAGK